MRSPSSSYKSRTATLASCVALLSAAGAVNAIITPTAPWSTVVDVTGKPCDIQWNLDPTGTWTNMTIQFMTGDNQHFVHLADIATNVDGTTGAGTFSWTCPAVTIPAQIYFYQFINDGDVSGATYTTRFTIANADGTTVPAPQQTQPDGSAIPWGVGGIVGQAGQSGGTGGANAGSGGSATPSASSSASAGNPDNNASSDSGAAPDSSSSVTSRAPISDASDSASSASVPPASSSSIATIRRTTAASQSTGTAASNSAINAANASSSTTPNGSASKAFGSVAGLGLALAMLAGLTLA